MRVQQEIAVEARKPADGQLQRVGKLRFQAVFFFRGQMMMPHIGRIGEDEIKALRWGVLVNSACMI